MDLHGGHLTSSAADSSCLSLFFFNDTATTEIYTLSLHDALPIWTGGEGTVRPSARPADRWHIRARPRVPGAYAPASSLAVGVAHLCRARRGTGAPGHRGPAVRLGAPACRPAAGPTPEPDRGRP